VYGAARTAEGDDRGLTEPSFRGVVLRGLPGFLREGFLPLGAFYAGWKLSGLTAGIVASVVVSALVYAGERRAGRDGLVVRLALLWVVVKGTAGLLAGSATVYLGAPVLANALWGLAFLVSIAIGRPLAGTLANAWYPFPPEYRRTPEFRRVFGIESAVWGGYLLALSAARAAILLEGSIGSFVLVSVLAGTPMTVALTAWSIWYATRKLARP
jgi:intracellular septation protein A